MEVTHYYGEGKAPYKVAMPLRNLSLVLNSKYSNVRKVQLFRLLRTLKEATIMKAINDIELR